jgi:exopolysaccharide production protein ExoQ
VSDQSQQIVSGQLAPFHIRLRDSKLVTFAEWFCCVLAFSFVQINGTLNVAAFLLLLIGLGAWNLSRSVSGLVAAAPILVFSFFALASTVWSEVPNLTLRYSLQYVATAACSVIAARSLSPRSFLSALMLSTLVSLSLSLAFGEYKYDGVSRSFAFIGIFGSKNFLAFIVTIAIVLAVSATIDRRSRW